MKQIELGEIAIEVVQKPIKNVHLSVYPPSGRVRISAPQRMDLDTIRVFAISKLGWIKKQQNKFCNQYREAPRDYVTRESHYHLGKRYLLRVIENGGPPKIVINHGTIEMYVRAQTSQKKRQGIMDDWYRKELRAIAPAIIERYEKIMDVEVDELGIKKMRTRWGTCSRNRKRVWLNLELAKKPKEYIEYIIVHEMAHLLEKHHNDNFATLMDKFLPKWRHYKEALNRIPLRYENWSYE